MSGLKASESGWVPPSPPSPGYLKIAQVAQMLGVSVMTVRRWDEVLCPVRTAGGHRRYRRDVVARVYEAGLEEPRP